MYRLFPVVAIAALMFTTGCEDAVFDYYPHHEVPTTQSDLMKSGEDSYGGHDHHTPIIIPGAGSATNPSSTAPTTSSGLP